MQLSKYFTLEEMTRSQTAIRRNLDNTPDQDTIGRLKLLCGLLDEVRELLGKPVGISSGYRSLVINSLIGGVNKPNGKVSQHVKGEAADFYVPGMTVEEVYLAIKTSGIKFDQLIQEFDSWIHMSYSDTPRGQCLRAIKQNGRTIYKADN